jgi:hypothetical protein
MAIQLQALKLLHSENILDGVGEPSLNQQEGVFYVKTCQRQLWIFFDSRSFALEGAQLLQSFPAYVFLLQICCGLQSKVPAETEIFGQIKKAWQDYCYQYQNRGCLDEFMQKLFEDTKDIRAQYLQGLGSSSYGSLLRFFFKKKEQRLLLVGAGQLADALMPFLKSFCLSFMNRKKIQKEKFEPQLPWLQTGEHFDAVILAIPFDPAVMDFFLQCAPLVIHFGLQKKIAPYCDFNLICLEDLFQISESHFHLREKQIALAKKACQKKAFLRHVGPAAGWDDLAFLE